MSYEKYLDTISDSFKKAVKVEWLNEDETVNFEFTNSLYDIGVDVSVNYQNGARRACTLTLNNDRNKFPINFNNIWFGQKFKLWMGVYIDEKTPYYFPQGVFYVSNPLDTYNPQTRTIQINGVDKWAWLDGSLNGVLSGTYQTNIGNNLYDATRELLRLPNRHAFSEIVSASNWDAYFVQDKNTGEFEWSGEQLSGSISTLRGEAEIILIAKCRLDLEFNYSYKISPNDSITLEVGGQVINIDGNGSSSRTGSEIYRGRINAGDKLTVLLDRPNEGGSSSMTLSSIAATTLTPIDPIEPFISPVFMDKTHYIPNTDVEYDKDKKYYRYEKGEYTEYEKDLNWSSERSTLYVVTNAWQCPYTAKVERGKTYADVLLEYATILCAHIYYDVNGRLTIEPMIDTADDITDTNKEVLWNFTVEEKTFTGLSQTYNFDKIYNDIIVLGNVVNGYQFKARVQNRNLMSDTCVQKIGLKTKPPHEDNQYYSDDQCKEIAMYNAKIDTIMQKSGTISSTPLYHLDVNKLVTVSTPNNNMSKELFLISGYSIGSSDSMSLNVVSVNILKDFSVVEATVNG